MKKIPLTQEQVALVDDDDYARLSKHKWYAHWEAKTCSFYARRNGERDANGKQPCITMTRVIMHAHLGQEVDHKIHNTLDNRKANLRLCTSAENHHNREKRKAGSSGRKGVYWNKRARKWRAQIRYKGQCSHLGYYTYEDDAARAYDEAAKKYFGEFARLNFPDDRKGKNQ